MVTRLSSAFGWQFYIAYNTIKYYGIPCGVDSAEFPYITLKCKLKN